MQTIIPFLLLYYISAIHCFPSPDSDDFKRADLFLDEPFFLGIPNIDLEAGDGLGLDDESNAAMTNDQLDLQARLTGGKNKDKSAPHLLWPGRTTKFIPQNSGTDVAKAFQENLENQKQRASDLDVKSAIEAVESEISQCEDNCRGMDTLSDKWSCILDCATKNKGPLAQVADVLFFGIKTLCQSISTFYSKFDQLHVKDLETFQAIMSQVEYPMPVSSNVPLRSLLVKLIQEVFTTMNPFRSLFRDFSWDLSGLENSLNLKANVLVGGHPGCSMVDMKRHIRTVLGIISKDPSQADYIMLQGYALFTALTKYVDEFPTKKEFSALNQGLDMMLGTNCGMFLYGETGETSACDQYGGFPVLNMPVPKFMWPDDLHESCQDEKDKMLENKAKETARRKRENVAEPAAIQSEKRNNAAVGESQTPKQNTIRRRRSLVVGRN